MLLRLTSCPGDITIHPNFVFAAMGSPGHRILGLLILDSRILASTKDELHGKHWLVVAILHLYPFRWGYFEIISLYFGFSKINSLLWSTLVTPFSRVKLSLMLPTHRLQICICLVTVPIIILILQTSVRLRWTCRRSINAEEA